jgi:hypothetical protein
MNHHLHRFTLTDVSFAADRPARSLTRDIDEGLLPVEHLGNEWYVTEDALTAYLQLRPQADREVDPAVTLLDRLPGMEPGSPARKFALLLSRIIKDAVDEDLVADRCIPGACKVASILGGDEPFSRDRAEIRGTHLDWGTFRIVVGSPAAMLSVVAEVFNPDIEAWPGPILTYKGLLPEVGHAAHFEGAATLINTIIRGGGIYHAGYHESPETKAYRRKKFLEICQKHWGASLPSVTTTSIGKEV